MKVLCPVCGRMGILQVRGNSKRAGHYVGYRGRTSVVEWHLVKNGNDGNELMEKNKVDLRLFSQNKVELVDRAGFEPAASAMRTRRSYQTDLPALMVFFRLRNVVEEI